MVLMVIAGLPENDESFMLKLYKEYYGLVRKTVYNITRDMSILEDLVNDIFLKLIEKTSLLRTLESCEVAAYVVYTSRSVAINYIKRENVQNKHILYGNDADMAEKIIDIADTFVDRIIHQEELAELNRAIARLPEKEKDLLYFKYILEMNDQDIAEIFGIAPNSVRQYLTRARRKAKQIMVKEMNGNAE